MTYNIIRPIVLNDFESNPTSNSSILSTILGGLYRFDSNSADLSASEFEVPDVQISLAWGNQTGQNDPITP